MLPNNTKRSSPFSVWCGPGCTADTAGRRSGYRIGSKSTAGGKTEFRPLPVQGSVEKKCWNSYDFRCSSCSTGENRQTFLFKTSVRFFMGKLRRPRAYNAICCPCPVFRDLLSNATFAYNYYRPYRETTKRA